MKFVLKIISALALWSIPIYQVVVIDPILVRDVGITGWYLPFTIPLFLAILYTTYLLTGQFALAFIITGLIILGLILGISGIMNLFLGCVILALIFFTLYIFKRH